MSSLSSAARVEAALLSTAPVIFLPARERLRKEEDEQAGGRAMKAVETRNKTIFKGVAEG